MIVRLQVPVPEVLAPTDHGSYDWPPALIGESNGRSGRLPVPPLVTGLTHVSWIVTVMAGLFPDVYLLVVLVAVPV